MPWPIPELNSLVPRRAIELTTDEYDARQPYWEFFRHSDELTGGYAASVKTYTEAEDPPTVDKSYLIPHEKEDPTAFARRVSMANPPRFVQEGITSITGVLTAQPPNRTEYPEELAEWMQSVTTNGASWQQLIASKIVPLVERYGCVYTLARRPTIWAKTEKERQDAIDASGLPEVLVHLITPEAVKWWVTDEVDNFEILRYVEIVEEYVYDNGYVTDTREVERHWWVTREGWWYCDDRKEGAGSENEDEPDELKVENLGYWDGPGKELEYFPIVKWALKDDVPPTETASFAQLAYYRAESELKKIEEASAFSMTWIPIAAADANPTEIVKGSDVVGTFDSEAKHIPFMLEPQGVAFSHYIEHRLPELEEQALSPYGRQREVGGNDSGVALAHIQETAKNIWRQHAKAFSQSEFNALQPVAELLGVELPVDLKADWPTQFGTLADSKQIENIQVFMDSEPGPEFKKLALLAMSEVCLPNATQSERDEAIDAYDKEQEEREAERKAFEAEQADLFGQESGQKPFNAPKPFAANPKSAAGPAKER